VQLLFLPGGQVVVIVALCLLVVQRDVLVLQSFALAELLPQWILVSSPQGIFFIVLTIFGDGDDGFKIRVVGIHYQIIF
jgi:hypothetical protein